MKNQPNQTAKWLITIGACIALFCICVLFKRDKPFIRHINPIDNVWGDVDSACMADSEDFADTIGFAAHSRIPTPVTRVIDTPYTKVAYIVQLRFDTVWFAKGFRLVDSLGGMVEVRDGK